MKFNKKFPILAIIIIGLMSSCSSEIDSSEFEQENLIITQSKTLILPVDLGVSGNFAILSKSGITNVPPSAIIGDVGTSPITGAALLLTCPQVTGDTYTVDAAGPLACRITDGPGLTTAVLNMQAAYTDAAGRSNPDFLNVGAGIIGGLTLAPGLHKWTSTLLIPTDITISGGPNDVWIFQVSGTLTMSSAVRINLEGGAQASNIFWQVSGAVTLGTTSHFEGILLGATSIAVQTGASVNGRLLAQTAVTLQMNTVTEPASTPASAPVAIGDLRDGGVVFWVDPDDNTHGLVCAMSDYESNVQWGCHGTDLPNVPNVANNGNLVGPGAEIGYGESNTNFILDGCSGAPAALAARSLGVEWFLPSILELKEMYVHKATLEAVPGFNAIYGYYWSSSEFDFNNAWLQNFFTGNYYYLNKDYTFNSVRAVRAF
jgi:hypothetical protein